MFTSKKNKGKKYVLIEDETMVPRHWTTPSQVKFFRIKAVRNIVLYNVKAGDLGGLVSDESCLSHKGNAWIAYGAMVQGNVQIQEDAYIQDNAVVGNDFSASLIVVRGKAQIKDNAQCYIAQHEPPKGEKRKSILSTISGSATIQGDTVVKNSTISGCSVIADNVKVLGSSISGVSIIGGNAIIGTDTIIEDSNINGSAVIGDGSTVKNSTVTERATIKKNSKILKGTYNGNAFYTTKEDQSVKTFLVDGVGVKSTELKLDKKPTVDDDNADTDADTDTNDTKAFLDEIIEKINAYDSDITKIIQYPAMTDRSNPHTSAMVKALNKALRIAKSGKQDGFEEAVDELETKFLVAESNAIKLSNTMLNVEEVKKTVTAKKMLNMAANEASTEHEKKTAFEQAFKALEGVIAVPEIAKDAFRAKVGLKELEMFS